MHHELIGTGLPELEEAGVVAERAAANRLAATSLLPKVAPSCITGAAPSLVRQRRSRRGHSVDIFRSYNRSCLHAYTLWCASVESLQLDGVVSTC
jgi:hypothetical protein